MASPFYTDEGSQRGEDKAKMIYLLLPLKEVQRNNDDSFCRTWVVRELHDRSPSDPLSPGKLPVRRLGLHPWSSALGSHGSVLPVPGCWAFMTQILPLAEHLGSCSNFSSSTSLISLCCHTKKFKRRFSSSWHMRCDRWCLITMEELGHSLTNRQSTGLPEPLPASAGFPWRECPASQLRR